jgi:hypothetical protein
MWPKSEHRIRIEDTLRGVNGFIGYEELAQRAGVSYQQLKKDIGRIKDHLAFHERIVFDTVHGKGLQRANGFVEVEIKFDRRLDRSVVKQDRRLRVQDGVFAPGTPQWTIHTKLRHDNGTRMIAVNKGKYDTYLERKQPPQHMPHILPRSRKDEPK